MFNRKRKTKTLETMLQADAFCSDLVRSTGELLDARFKDNDLTHMAYRNYLAKLVSMYVFKCLNQIPDSPCGSKELIKFTETSFLEAKQSVQDSVSAAFQAAVRSYCGEDIEYYCLVRATPKVKGQVC